MSAPCLDLDVRPILRNGGEPFGAIVEAVGTLTPGQSLRLLATFKPLPLFQVLGARGFEASAREIGGGDWEVIFTPAGAVAPEPEPAAAAADARGWPLPTMELDNRDLDPPEPMARTLEGIEGLAPGQTLAALLPREPLFLFNELRARGHSWHGSNEPEGHYRIVIRRGGQASS